MKRACKISLIFFMLVWLSGFCTNLTAQVLDNKYTFYFNNTPLESVVDTLRKSINYGFSFNPDGFPKDQKVSKKFIGNTLKTILDSIFIPIKFTYKVVGNNIVILPIETGLPDNNQQLTIEDIDTMKIIELSGKILNRKDKSPVEFASIYIHNKNIGTLSNEDGNFTIKLPKESADDSVYFSRVGYKPLKIKTGDLLPNRNIIFLDVNSIQLKEVMVKPIDLNNVLKRAIENIPRNYSRVPLMLIAFYRETIKQNNDYVGLSEAILNIYKASYNNYLNDQVSIYKARKNQFEKQMDTVVFKFQGGISTSLMLDIAKNPSNFITDEYLDYYDFSLAEITTIDGRYTYVIAFDQKDYAPYPLYKGKLYIDIDTYAIVRADFMISPKGLEKSADVLVKKSPRKLKVKPVFSSYIVNYTKQNNTWYLNYIREEVAFKVKKKYSFYSTTFQSKAEMVVTQTDSTNLQRIKLSKQVKYNDIFVEKLGKYDPEFWGNLNIIEPDESLEEALQKLRSRLPRVNH
jgi:hypothetical protein